MQKMKTYPNGLRLVVDYSEVFHSVSMGIMVGTGAAYETDEEDGISHYIEHTVFKGTKKRNTFEISEAFERIGSQVNAFTGAESTCFYCKSTVEHAEESFEILSDLFLHPAFPEDEVQKEKEVIVEEISMNEDTPEDLCLDVLCEAFYGQQGYGRTILGSEKTVRSFTKEQVLRYMRERYVPQNIVVSFAGGLPFAEVEKTVLKYMDMPAVSAPQRVIPTEIFGANYFRKKKIEQVHLAVGFPQAGRFAEERVKNAFILLNYILGDGMTSRLFQAVRERSGLAYEVYSYLSPGFAQGRLTVYAGVNKANVEKATEAIFQCFWELLQGGVTEAELSRAKEIAKASMIFAAESSNSRMLSAARSVLFYNEISEIEDRVKGLEAVTAKDIAQATKMAFLSPVTASAIVGNVSKPLTLPKIGDKINSDFSDMRKIGFSPVYDAESKILILGSFPSVQSRKVDFYYGNPQNRFWGMLSDYFGEKIGDSIEEKKEFLLRKHIALWDIVESCTVQGSADATIRDYEIADLSVFADIPIRAILLNGAKAYEIFRKKYSDSSVPFVKMQSTSPANPRFTKEAWYAELRKYL